MNVISKVNMVERKALDRGFVVEKQKEKGHMYLTIFDNGKDGTDKRSGMEMELTDSDSLIPFAALTDNADQAFRDFALEIVGLPFEEV